METYLDAAFCPEGVHPLYLQRFMELKDRIESFLQSILDESNDSLDRVTSRDALISLRNWLLLLPIY